MKRVSKNTTLFVMAITMMMTACESPSKGNSNDKSNSKEPEETTIKYPAITEKGVTPFLLNESFLDIPPQGDYYDNIKLNRFYSVIMGDHIIDITDDELNDYYDDFGSDADVLGFYGTGVVMQGNDTLLIATYDENGVISEVEVFSEKLHLENGIHVGLSSETMASKYNASFFTTDYFAGEAWMCYNVNGLHKDITLLATKNYDIFDGFEPNCGKKMDGGDGETTIYEIPMNKVINCRVASIHIMKNGYKCFHPKEVCNENYQAELQRHMSELRQMDDRNQDLKRREEEKDVDIDDMSWLYGTWSRMSDGVQITVVIDKKQLILRGFIPGVDALPTEYYRGPYTIYMNRIEFTTGSEKATFWLDIDKKELYTNDGYRFRK